MYSINLFHLIHYHFIILFLKFLNQDISLFLIISLNLKLVLSLNKTFQILWLALWSQVYVLNVYLRNVSRLGHRLRLFLWRLHLVAVFLFHFVEKYVIDVILEEEDFDWLFHFKFNSLIFPKVFRLLMIILLSILSYLLRLLNLCLKIKYLDSWASMVVFLIMLFLINTILLGMISISKTLYLMMTHMISSYKMY